MPEINKSKFLVQATWDDVPHLDQETRKRLLESVRPHQRQARSEGRPALGSGAIYPIDEKDFLCESFRIPKWWRRAYGMDVGWNRTAVVWGALDPDEDILYLYTEHYRSQAEPSIHAQAVKARGTWIPGAIDPAARGRSQADGEALLAQYRQLGLLLTPADNGVESGIYAVLERLSTGRLRVFKTLSNWRAEHALYRRDENGKVVKQHDHLMDAMRYLVVTGLKLAQAYPVLTEPSMERHRGTSRAGY